jgi:hypothetical protein
MKGYDRPTIDPMRLKTTRYFEEQVLRKRPYIKRDWCAEVLRSPVRRRCRMMAGSAIGAMLQISAAGPCE